MKRRVRIINNGSPRRTARQTVLKTPSSFLVTMVSQMELKKELIFSMVLGWSADRCPLQLTSKSWVQEDTALDAWDLFLFQL